MSKAKPAWRGRSRGPSIRSDQPKRWHSGEMSSSFQPVSTSVQSSYAHADRRMFDKLMKDRAASIHSYDDAIRFIKALVLISTTSPLEAIWRLQSPEQLGKQRLVEILTLPSRIPMLTDAQVVNTLYIPVLKLASCSEARYDQTAASGLQLLANVVWSTPFVKERILKVTAEGDLQDVSAVIYFLIVFVITNRQAAASDCNTKFLQVFVQEFIQQGHSIAERISKELDRIGAGPFNLSASLMSVDYQPGGRHDNDFYNIADISIVPTCQEASLLKKKRNEMAYLPRADSLDDHLRDYPSAALRDRAFRLLREDMISSLREQLATDKERKLRFVCISASSPEFQPRPYIEIFIKVPDHVRTMTVQEEREFWIKSKWLAKGSLCCLCKDGQPVTFVEILQQHFRKPSSDPKAKAKFTDSVHVSISDRDSLQAIFQLQNNNGNSVFEIVVACASYFAFKPVLEALQSSDDSELLAYIASDNFSKSTEAVIESAFVQKNADLIKNPEFPDLVFDRNRLDSCKISASIIDKYVLLDDTQKEALLNAVSFHNKISLIQGPPGTGKTLIGVLVALTLTAIEDVKILCVCYTNHQLDQFLESILDAGITDIIRIGGRSQSVKLAPYNPNDLMIKADRTSNDINQFYGSHDRDLRSMIQELQDEIKPLQTALCLKRLHPFQIFEHYIQSSELIDQFHYSPTDGFVLNGRNRKPIRNSADLFSHWCKGGNVPFLKDMPLWTLSSRERHSMIDNWEPEIRSKLTDLVAAKYQAIARLQEEKRSIRNIRYAPILNKVKIIGCTTTGAAIYRSVLSQAKCNILIIEEAAEILEAHILSILTDRIEKMVMIGDHKQLRPKINDYELTVESGNGYDLNRSTFERLILAGHPFICLETQHRMRPEISQVVRDLCYNALKDGDRVLRYPNVKGMQENVVFVKHYEFEEQAKVLGTASNKLIKSGSKVNKHEAQLIIATAVYLRQQGYGPEDIVILTPYLGQLAEINRQLSTQNIKAVLGDIDSEELDTVFGNDKFESAQFGPNNGSSKQQKAIRVSTVDNFQGEQAPIILVSLVRSNLNDEIGFVKKVERINVLISRAQMGLIVFGNDQCLGGKCQSWKQVLSYFNCYDGVPVCCSRHGTPAVMSKLEDFQKLAPNGGCQQKCDFVLGCGHECSLQCHDAGIIAHRKCQVQVHELCPHRHRLWRHCSAKSLPACKEEICDICAKSKHQFVRQCGLDPVLIRCPICLNQKELKKRIKRIELQKQKRLTEITEEQAKRMIQIDEENAKIAADAEVEEKRQEAEAHLQEAQARKFRTELETKRNSQKIAAKVAEQIRKCEEESAKAIVNEHERCDRLVEQARQRNIQLFNEQQITLQEIDAFAKREVSKYAIEREGKQEQLNETLKLRDHLRKLALDITCSICFDDFKLMDGVSCSNDNLLHDTLHFFCSSCFEQYVASQSAEDVGILSAREAKIYCPVRGSSGCNSAPFGDDVICRAISTDVFTQYLNAKKLVLEKQLSEEIESTMPARIEAEIRLRQCTTALRLKILDVLTPKCQRCKSAFIDFDGCCALTCSQCKCGFCAYCLLDCGVDAHAHVANCPYNRKKSVFAKQDEWRRSYSVWVRDQIIAILRHESINVAQIALEECKREIKDVDVEVRHILEVLKSPA